MLHEIILPKYDSLSTYSKGIFGNSKDIVYKLHFPDLVEGTINPNITIEYRFGGWKISQWRMLEIFNSLEMVDFEKMVCKKYRTASSAYRSFRDFVKTCRNNKKGF